LTSRPISLGVSQIGSAQGEFANRQAREPFVHATFKIPAVTSTAAGRSSFKPIAEPLHRCDALCETWNIAFACKCHPADEAPILAFIERVVGKRREHSIEAFLWGQVRERPFSAVPVVLQNGSQ